MKKIKLNYNLGAFIDYLGEPEYSSNCTHKWQCPLCKDSHKDNLIYNEEKGVIWCFADETHAPKVLKEMIRSNKIKAETVEKENEQVRNIPPDKYKLISEPDKQNSFHEYMSICNRNLYCRPELYKYLFNQRAIRKETLNYIPLGYDVYKRLWVIPTIEYTTNNDTDNIILGFEYRPVDFSNKKGIFREKGSPTGLAMINQFTSKAEILVVVEGYFDGYVLWQYLNDEDQSDYYHIVTPSNGVTSLLKHISKIDFDKYKKFYLFLDNDEPGNNATEKIIEKYPIFEKFTLNSDCKDFNEHYIKYLKDKYEKNTKMPN